MRLQVLISVATLCSLTAAQSQCALAPNAAQCSKLGGGCHWCSLGGGKGFCTNLSPCPPQGVTGVLGRPKQMAAPWSAPANTTALHDR